MVTRAKKTLPPGPFDRKAGKTGWPTRKACKIGQRWDNWFFKTLNQPAPRPDSPPSVAKEYILRLMGVLRKFIRPEEIPCEEMTYFCFHHPHPFGQRIMRLEEAMTPVLVWLGDNGMNGTRERLTTLLHQAGAHAARQDSAPLPPVGSMLSKGRDPEEVRDESYVGAVMLRGDFVSIGDTLGKLVERLSSGPGEAGGTGENRFTDTEKFILEALGGGHMTGLELLKKAGYDYSSHYRQILSNLVKRGILGHNHTGYFRCDT